MIDIDFVESLIRMLDESALDSLEIRRGGTRIRLSKSPDGHAAVASPPANNAAPERAAVADQAQPAAGPEPEVPDGAFSAGLMEVTSPMVGTFYRAPSPEAAPYVEVGSTVAAGEVLCVIEAMKLMNELECETAGRIVEVCVDNAEPVDFGQVLFRVDPA